MHGECGTYDHIILRAAACKDRSALGVLLCILGAALHAVGGVGHWKDDGPFIGLSHGCQHLGREDGPRAREAYQRCRLDLPEDCLQLEYTSSSPSMHVFSLAGQGKLHEITRPSIEK